MKFSSINSSIKSARGQRGAVLIVALIMLVISTMLVISMMKTSVLELKIGGADQVYANNFTNAETAISKFIADNSGRFAPGFLALASSSGGAIISPPTGLVGGTVSLVAQQISCGQEASSATTTKTVLFDVAAIATGTLAGSRLIMHQGLLTTAKSCGSLPSSCLALKVSSNRNTTAQSCNSVNACIHSDQHTNDCTNFCNKDTGKDDSGHDCSFTCDVSGKDKDNNDCTIFTNPGVTKGYWYVESEQ